MSNIHALLHNEHQQDDKYNCHDKHYETKHHHCELDTFTLAFDAPTALFLKLTAPTQHNIHNGTYVSYTPLEIHYLFALKAPPTII